MIIILAQPRGINKGARLAQTLLGASETERLAEAAKLFAQTAELLRDFGNMFVLANLGSGERRVLFERRRRFECDGRAASASVWGGATRGYGSIRD